MTDDELAMAYADGELDEIAARRFEQRMAEVPALALAVASHRALRAQLSNMFAPVAAEPVPDRLTAMLKPKVVPLRPGNRRRVWWTAGAMAASLVLGIMVGQFGRPGGPVAIADNRLVASGALATALDRQLASDEGATRVLVSFQGTDKAYCRVFSSPAVDGIACREGKRWELRHTRAADSAGQATAYRQAGSADPALMAAAQDMMAGDPLDPAAERRARDALWK
ncbi:anti-sigma factor [Sphingomonas canadensis]|uniref:Anti-sigma factor n=1 Tax=Sphingomonas canadensis TaxID=1219257 RepID=A0ABW3H7K9_9SPHN|nr:anti-sigma factor [Sphingomonas canadensis]MCW3834454.1 anti-sigma factor [Sphingomonas canadensis]